MAACSGCEGSCANGGAKCEETQQIHRALEPYVAPWRTIPGGLIPILHHIQQDLGYIPRPWAMGLSEMLSLPLAQIYEILTFYSHFKLVPQGKYNIQLCFGTACYLKGSAAILKVIQEKLQIREGETTADCQFHLDFARCLGACGLAPVVTINGEVHGRMTPEKMAQLLQELAATPAESLTI